MNVLAGYFGKTKRFDHREMLNRAIAFLAGSETNETDFCTIVSQTDNAAVIQRYHQANPPLVACEKDSAGNALYVKGFVYSDALEKYPCGLLHECLHRSPDMLHDLEGEFIAVVLDSRKGLIHIVNDRFGSRPFFILQTEDAVYFSSNLCLLHAMGGARPEIDAVGWMQIFAHGYTVHERTHCLNTQRIRNASTIVISKNGIQKRQYWRLTYDPQYDLDPDAYAETVFTAFRRGVRKRARLKPSGVLALSGGLDSRLVASGLSGLSNVSALTFIDSTTCAQTDEVQAAALVASKLGIPHRVEALSVGHVSDSAKAIIKLNGGLIPLHHPAKTMSLINSLKQTHQTLLLGGGPGNNLSGGFVHDERYLNPVQKHSLVADYMVKNSLNGERTFDTLALLFNSDYLNAHYPAAEAAYRESFDEIEAVTAAQIISAWEMICGYPAFTSNSPIHADPNMMEASAHLDYAYCDLMLKLPEQWLLHQRFYQHMIYRCIPETRQVINANNGRCLTSQKAILKAVPPAPDNSAVGPNSAASVRSRLNLASCHSVMGRIVEKIRTKLNMMPCTTIPFVYSMLSEDKKLVANLRELTHSHDYLRHAIDTDKCDRYLNHVHQGKLHFDSYYQDAEILGSLASFCYMYDHCRSFSGEPS
jgi:hypothetical protein